MKVYINNQDFAKYVNNDVFSIVRKLKDYHAELELFVPISLLHFLIPSVDVKIKNGEKTIFGGIIYTIKFGKKIKDKIEVFLTLENYNIFPARRTISDFIDLEPTDPDPNLDQNTAGAMVARYVDLYLSQDGITKGNIGTGARIAEDLEVDAWDTQSLKEIFDTLADMTGDNWFIDIDKKLHFASEATNPVNHMTTETKLTEENHNFYNMEVEKTIENYKNKIFVVGGDPWEEVPEEYLDYDGNIKYVKENEAEIQKMKTLNEDSGVWGYVIRDEKIEHLEDAQKKAEAELKKYGRIPIKIKVSTELDIFKPSDTILVNLPNYNIEEQPFTIERMEITVNENGDVVYTLDLINQIEAVGEKEDLIQFMEKLVKEAKKRDTKKTNSGGGTGDFGLPQIKKIMMWVDMQEEDTIIKDNNNNYWKIKEVKDKITGNTALFQADRDRQPALKTINGVNWIDFAGEYSEHLNLVNTIDVGTAFVIFYDKTPYSHPGYSCPLGEYYEGGPLDDNMLAGVSALNTNLFVNGIPVSIKAQKRIREQTTLITVTTNDGGSNVLVAFGRNKSNTSGFNIYYTGLIAEIIVYNTVLSNTEITQVNNYLMQKYNIA